MVVDPLHGLPGRSKWLPTAQEVKSACEDIYGPTRRRLEREENERAQLREREAIERKRTGAKQTYEELCAEMTARGLPMGRPAPKPLDVEEVCKKLNITRDDFDALPDLPLDHGAKVGAIRCDSNSKN